MYFADHLTLDAPRRTKDGFLAVRARAARTGVYQYSGREVDPDNAHGLRDQASVNVLRDDATVFDERAVRSFIGKPVTDDHPHEAVTRDNWRDHARGTIMGAMRDGDYLAFDLLLTDGPTIDKVESGKRELSNGYGADLEFGDFKAADGTACQARQSKITGGNHVALVDRGRAGPECRIADAFAICDANPEAVARLSATPTGDIPMKTLTIDGLRVPNVSDEAEAAITKLQDALAKADASVTTITAERDQLAKDKATLETEKKTLEQKLKDEAITPAKLRDAGKTYTQVTDKAKALGVKFDDDDSTETVMKKVVDAKMGDAAKDWTADQVAASFAVLTKDGAAITRTAPSGTPIIANDGASVRDLARTARY